MKWEKKGLVYVPENNNDWSVSHAQLPVVDQISEEVLRVYFGTRDASSRTVTTYIEVEAANPHNVLYVHDKPVLGLGKLGCFDDNGAMPSWIINNGKQKYLYYIGWNTGVSVSYRNSIGLAVSNDDGQTFTRLYEGPIVDRSATEPHFCGASCVIKDNGMFRMWYLNAVRWEVFDGRAEPVYHIKYAESANGIHWDRRGIVSLELKSFKEGGLTRPCVVMEEGRYKMWYCYRGIKDYRVNPSNSYRIGYAESLDGIHWDRMDERAGIDVSENGWDSEMVTYAHVYKYKGNKYMMYNGNGFGRSGIGYAALV